MQYKFLHTCIRVLDLEKSVDFYKNTFGFKETERKDHSDEEEGFILVYMTNHEGNFELELTYNCDQKEPYDLGNGYSHLALTVDDLEASRERHIEMGYECTDLYGLPGDEKPRFYFITDPDGYDIEILRA